jgi:hypothetical protein
MLTPNHHNFDVGDPETRGYLFGICRAQTLEMFAVFCADNTATDRRCENHIVVQRHENRTMQDGLTLASAIPVPASNKRCRSGHWCSSYAPHL